MIIKANEKHNYINGPLELQPFNYWLRGGEAINIHTVKTITYDKKMIIVEDKWYQELLKKHLETTGFIYCWNYNTNQVDILIISGELINNLELESTGREGMFSLSIKQNSLVLNYGKKSLLYNFRDNDTKIIIESYNKSELIDYIRYPLDDLIKFNRLANTNAFKVISNMVKLTESDGNMIKMRQLKYFYKLNFDY